MANQIFWKFAAVALIAVTFYVAHGLHQSSESNSPKLLSAASADEPKNTDHPIRWIAVDQPKHMPSTLRTKVEGGWLVIAINEHKQLFGLTFIPDRDHSWRVAR
jgi:hypothetical protein